MEKDDSLERSILLDSFWGLFMPGECFRLGDIIWEMNTVYDLPDDIRDAALKWYSRLPNEYVVEEVYEELAPLFEKQTKS